MRKKYILVLFIYVLPNSFIQQIPLFAQQGVGFSGDMIALRDQESDELLWYSPISITIKDKELNAWLGFNLGIRLFKQKMLPPLEDKPFITLD